MKLVITMCFDNSAFNGKHCARELPRILWIVTDRMDIESKSDLIRGCHGEARSLFDINDNSVGAMEIADDRDVIEQMPTAYSSTKLQRPMARPPPRASV